MIYSYSEIVNLEANVRKARNAISSSKYKKIAPGFYSDTPDNESYINLIFKRYKNVTITMQSAFEYYNLTDVNYDKYTLAFPHGSRKIKDDKIKQLFIETGIYDIGRGKIRKNDSIIYIYNKERLLIELIRNKRKLPYDYYKEIIHSYRKLVSDGLIDTKLLLQYAKSFKKGDNIIETIMEVVA